MQLYILREDKNNVIHYLMPTQIWKPNDGSDMYENQLAYSVLREPLYQLHTC